MESVVDLVRASAFPPVTGMLKALKMPLSLEENRILFPSAENDAPLTVVVAMNCSIEYCFNGRWLPEPLLAALAAAEAGLSGCQSQKLD